MLNGRTRIHSTEKLRLSLLQGRRSRCRGVTEKQGKNVEKIKHGGAAWRHTKTDVDSKGRIANRLEQARGNNEKTELRRPNRAWD